jgi:hypothetical protein
MGDNSNDHNDNSNRIELMHLQDFKVTFVLCYILLCKLLEINIVSCAGSSVVLIKDAINIICTINIQYSAYDSGAKPCQNVVNI